MKKQKFLIITETYISVLDDRYKKYPKLKDKSYNKQMKHRRDELFGVSYFYAENLEKLGFDAMDIEANNEWAQKAWMKEHNFSLDNDILADNYNSYIKKTSEIFNNSLLKNIKHILKKFIHVKQNRPAWFHAILAKQIEYYKPDIVLNHALNSISVDFIKAHKNNIGFLIGQHAATQLSVSENYSCYDLAISSFPPTVEYFKKLGINAEFHKLGFEESILDEIEGDNELYDITFVGSLMQVHSSRIPLLEKICQEFPQTKIWTNDLDNIPINSPIRKCVVGKAFGKEMYQILKNSKITLNHHGDVAPFANNLRLYEATGMGCLLITDYKENLSDIFKIDKEIVAYKNIDECIDKIRYYLEYAEERKKIANAGQMRTLKEHTYFNGMKELVEIINRRKGEK